MIIQAFYKIIIISKKIDKSLKFSRSNNCNININNNFQNGINKQTFKSFHAPIHFLLPISSKLYLQYLRFELSHLKFRNIREILLFNYFLITLFQTYLKFEMMIKLVSSISSSKIFQRLLYDRQ